MSTGQPAATIDWYTRQGRIEHRPAKGQRPSLKRESVEEFAVWWAERQAAKQRKKDAAEQRSRDWLEPPEPTGWLTTQEAAEILGVNRKHVLWLIDQGHLKAVKTSPRRWWVDEASVRSGPRSSARTQSSGSRTSRRRGSWGAVRRRSCAQPRTDGSGDVKCRGRLPRCHAPPSRGSRAGQAVGRPPRRERCQARLPQQRGHRSPLLDDRDSQASWTQLVKPLQYQRLPPRSTNRSPRCPWAGCARSLEGRSLRGASLPPKLAPRPDRLDP